MNAADISERLNDAIGNAVDEQLKEDDGKLDADVGAVAAFAIGQGLVLRKNLVDALVRIEQLESRLGEVEKGGISFGGLYQRALSYKKGCIVTYKGSAWIALSDIAGGVEPTTTAHWALMVKAGRDASSKDRRGE